MINDKDFADPSKIDTKYGGAESKQHQPAPNHNRLLYSKSHEAWPQSVYVVTKVMNEEEKSTVEKEKHSP